jgi:3-oxoacyl-(acyl-carrier-protein) synthase
MNDLVIAAASCLTPSGYGNDKTGFQKWPAEAAAALRQGDLSGLRWSLLFDSAAERFSRMDGMCRLGFMAVELLDAGLSSWDAARRDRVGVCVETRAGCLDTDVRFLRTSSPNAFTYTLPSTVVGEISIRYHLRGPGLCLMKDAAEPGLSVLEAAGWLAAGQVDACLCVEIEAVGGEAARWLPELGEALTSGWFAGALLLARREGRTRERPWRREPVRTLCAALGGMETS